MIIRWKYKRTTNFYFCFFGKFTMHGGLAVTSNHPLGRDKVTTLPGHVFQFLKFSTSLIKVLLSIQMNSWIKQFQSLEPLPLSMQMSNGVMHMTSYLWKDFSGCFWNIKRILKIGVFCCQTILFKSIRMEIEDIKLFKLFFVLSSLASWKSKMTLASL